MAEIFHCMLGDVCIAKIVHSPFVGLPTPPDLEGQWRVITLLKTNYFASQNEAVAFVLLLLPAPARSMLRITDL